MFNKKKFVIKIKKMRISQEKNRFFEIHRKKTKNKN